jgi:hypothetical protein
VVEACRAVVGEEFASRNRLAAGDVLVLKLRDESYFRPFLPKLNAPSLNHLVTKRIGNFVVAKMIANVTCFGVLRLMCSLFSVRNVTIFNARGKVTL